MLTEKIRSVLAMSQITNKTRDALKKIPYYLFLIVFTAGASLILGFLSFAGMYATSLNVLSSAASLVLAVLYEGEIFWQNIKSMFQILWTPNYLELYFAQKFLMEQFPENTAENTPEEDCPQFFKDYKKQFELCEAFRDKNLNEADQKTKEIEEQGLHAMQEWFASQLFARVQEAEENPLQVWLQKDNRQALWIQALKARAAQLKQIKGFALLSALSMGFGSTYLIIEACSALPLLAAFPFVFWPLTLLLSGIAGTAYGLMTANALIQLVNKDTWEKLKENFSKPRTFLNVIIMGLSLALMGLALLLTYCTAGTWLTIVHNTRPLFSWMTKIPDLFIRYVHPLITGSSSLFFIMENTLESMELVEKFFKNIFKGIQNLYKELRQSFQQVWQKENVLQMLNPFRLIIMIIIPLTRAALFFGHLYSIGKTVDRPPDLSEWQAMVAAFLSEWGEDFHYFWPKHKGGCHGHDHDETEEEKSEEIESEDVKQAKRFKKLLKKRLGPDAGHQHEMDIPFWFLDRLAKYTVYPLAAGWDLLCSQFNAQAIPDFWTAWAKHRSEEAVDKVFLPVGTTRSSETWKTQNSTFQIRQHINHLNSVWVGSDIAQAKSARLTGFLSTLSQPKQGNESLEKLLVQEIKQGHEIYRLNRMTLFAAETTSTEDLLQKLLEDAADDMPCLVSPSCAAC